MSTLIFPCGCTFPVDDGKEDTIHQDPMEAMPRGVKVDMFNIPHDCPATWDLLSSGRTKGVFQLEANLGRTWSKKVEPSNLEDLGALVALLRPGCLRAVNDPAVKWDASPPITIMKIAKITTTDGKTKFVESEGPTRIFHPEPGERYEVANYRHDQKKETLTMWFDEDSPLHGKVVVDIDTCHFYPPKSMTQHYADRKRGLEDVDFFDVAELEPILGNTYGILTYQEQSMKIAVTLAGFDKQEADVLRKAIGKKKADIMAQVKDGFLTGCTNQGIVTTEQAEMIFGWIQESQRYSFNKSHAVCYGEGSYWSAYCKAHAPVQFFCSYLRGANWKQDRYEEITQLVSDAQTFDVRVRVPDFRDLRENFSIKGVEIFFGLSSVRGIGASALEKIERNAAEVSRILQKDTYQWTWMDYLIYFSDRVSSTVTKSLINSGALDYLGIGRKRMLHEFDAYSNLTKKETEWTYDNQYENFTMTEPKWQSLATLMSAAAHTKKEGGACHNAKRVSKLESLFTILVSPPSSLDDTPHFISTNEERYLGLPLTCTEVDGCAGAADADSTCLDIHNGLSGQRTVAVTINRIKEIKTKKDGKPMAFMTITDSTCSLEDVVVFPEPWKEFSDKLYMGNTILMMGERDRNRGGFIVKNVWQI
jgi:DNA polymerase III alpha subunit